VSIFLGLLLSHLLNASSPKLGTYFTCNTWTNETIQLKSFHRDQYHFHLETTDISESGTYKAKSDRLTLHFKGSDHDIKKQKIKKEKNKKSSPTVGTVHNRLIDQLGHSPFAFAHMEVNQNGNPSHTPMSDESEHGEFSIAHTKLTTVIKNSMQEFTDFTNNPHLSQSPFITIKISKKYNIHKRVPNHRIVYHNDHRNDRNALWLKYYKEGHTYAFYKQKLAKCFL
jgi:hypothetical protein